MKKFLLIASLAVVTGGAFLVGYAAIGKAFPAGGVFGRAEYRGYFTNFLDTAGTYVLPNENNNSGTLEAFPAYINTAAEFIAYIESKLHPTGADTQEKTGAAFIINTMLGNNGAPGLRPLTTAQIIEWENTVKTAEAHGRITWRTNFSYTLNSYYQGPRGGCGSCADNDDAFYDDTATAPAMLFRDGSGIVRYALKWLCANPVGNLSTPIPEPWEVVGVSTVSDPTPDPGDTPTAITTRAGQTLSFSHTLTNTGPGPTGVDQIIYIVSDTVGGGTLVGPVNSGSYLFNESKTQPVSINVPPGTPAGTRYCQNISWDWRNSWGDRWGPSVPACATVAADFSLNPVVSVNQTTAQEGDVLTFTYSVNNTGTSASTPAQCNNQDGAGANIGTALTCSSPQTFAASTNAPVGTEAVVVGNQPAGSTICRQLVVNPATAAGGSRTSSQTCVIVAKTPYVRFMGNDVWAGGGFPSVTPACNTNAKITTVGRLLSSTPYTAQYYNNITLAGAPVLTRVESGINYTWPNGTSPAAGINHNQFSVRWTKTENFAAGTYDFVATADDGVRVYLDGVLIIDHWVDQGATTYTEQRSLGAGNHTVTMEYYDNTFGAVAQLNINPTTTIPSNYAGSGGEYTATALNQITGFGSAGIPMVGTGTAGGSARNLLFSNYEPTDQTKVGFYGTAGHCIQDYVSLFSSATPVVGGTFDVSTRGSGVWHVTTNTLTLHGTMPAGATQVYYSDRHVTIDANLTYPASYANLNAIPSLVVITPGHIYVESDVTQLDGLFVATGTGTAGTGGIFYTCVPRVEPASSSNACNANQLTINGAVKAGALDLFRTRGAEGATPALRQTPAEIFNFSPEMYLRNALQNSSTPVVEISNQIELPPRF